MPAYQAEEPTNDTKPLGLAVSYSEQTPTPSHRPNLDRLKGPESELRYTEISLEDIKFCCREIMTSRTKGMVENLDYCYDRGEQFINEENENNLWQDRLQGIDKAFDEVNQTLPAETQMKKRIAAAESTTPQDKPIIHPQALRRAMSPNLVQQILEQCDAYVDVEEAQRKDVASTICSSFRKVFAILLKFSKTNSIAEFIKLKIDDSNLPLRGKREGKRDGVCLKNNYFVFIEDWEKSDWQNFFNWQPAFLTPFFARPKGRVLHYPLESDDILPIIDREDYLMDEDDDRENESDSEIRKPLQIKRSPAAYGGHSTISKIKLDPLSCDFGDFQFRNRNDWYALKQLTEQSIWKEFLSEVYVWKLFNGKGEDTLHMSPLLCTFEKPGDDGKMQYFLLFPWASGDLRDFWANDSSAESPYTLCWMAEQLWRIAEALSVIHQDQEENNPTKPCDDSEHLYGRHGDIKPGNILWFADYVGCENAGSLVLADFGISKCHRFLTKSMSNPATAKYSPTYRSPEFNFNVSGNKIGRKSDIWSLACTCIEFVTWYLKGGQAGINEFADIRDETDPSNENISEDTYFSITKEGTIVKPKVVEWIGSLHRDDRCSLFLHDFLSFIEERMLVVDPIERATAHIVSENLMALYRESMNNNAYANSPSPWCPASS